MERRASYVSVLLCIASCIVSPATGQTPNDYEKAWEQLPQYAYGQDLAPLLAIERTVIEAMGTPAVRAETAHRLAALLEQPETTAAARQFICLQLRQIGTPAEIPVLAPLLLVPETSEMARNAIASIAGPESTDVLRNALGTLQGAPLIGVINALGARRDGGCVDSLKKLADAADPLVSQAALRALARVADRTAVDFLRGLAAKQPAPLPAELVGCLLQVAARLRDNGQSEAAAAIFGGLSGSKERPGTRRAGFEGSLTLETDRRAATIRDWFVAGDTEQRLVAARHLRELPDDMINELSLKVADLPDASGVVVVEVLADRRQQNLLPFVLEMVRSDKPDVRLAGIRCLGALRDVATISTLIDLLGADAEVSAVAQQSLGNLPREAVGPALLTALNRQEIRQPVIALLAELKCYEAIDPLIALAASNDPAVYGPVLEGLGRIADPDPSDLPRLVGLLYQTRPGTHRDEVEKTIAIVCNKLPADQDRAAAVLDLLPDADAARIILCLPLLGRLGGAKALQAIDAHMDSANKEAAEAAVRALCNWPTAEVADRLASLAAHSAEKCHRRWALRALVRVISLPSDRSPDQTLALLQTAMKQAEEAGDRSLVIERAASVRTIECLRWLAGYLDDPQLTQSACQSIVELAHHRELRHPHMDEFRPVLEKVAAKSTDATVVERANRYRLGL
ncbi:MAG: HEAT repeat domain-containing protein [Pirellulaceae bacterium]